jgi:hypothetical protein
MMDSLEAGRGLVRGAVEASDPISGDMTIQRMDNVLIVVDDLEAAKAFFAELGMELEGEAPVEGRWVDRGDSALVCSSSRRRP